MSGETRTYGNHGKDSTLATENPLNFGGNSDHVTARIMVTVDVPRHTQAVLRSGKGRLMPHTTLGMLHPGFVS